MKIFENEHKPQALVKKTVEFNENKCQKYKKLNQYFVSPLLYKISAINILRKQCTNLWP